VPRTIRGTFVSGQVKGNLEWRKAGGGSHTSVDRHGTGLRATRRETGVKSDSSKKLARKRDESCYPSSAVITRLKIRTRFQKKVGSVGRWKRKKKGIAVPDPCQVFLGGHWGILRKKSIKTLLSHIKNSRKSVKEKKENSLGDSLRQSVRAHEMVLKRLKLHEK